MSRISRRTVLRGVGVTMALPWLESLPAWGRPVATDGTRDRFPSALASCSWATASTGITGGPEGLAPR